MSDLDEQVRIIRDRIAAAQRGRARAEHLAAAAHDTTTRAMQALRTEFQVGTVHDARGKLTELRQALADELATITAELDRIEAPV